MGLSETGTIGDKPSSLGCPIFRQTPHGVSLIRDTQSSSNLTLGIFAWNSRVKRVPQKFWDTFKFEIEPSKMGLSENIGCPEIHWSLVNLPGHRYKIGTYSFQTHPCDTKLEKHKLAGSWVSIFSTDWSDKSPKPLAV